MKRLPYCLDDMDGDEMDPKMAILLGAFWGLFITATAWAAFYWLLGL